QVEAPGGHGRDLARVPGNGEPRDHARRTARERADQGRRRARRGRRRGGGPAGRAGGSAARGRGGCTTRSSGRGRLPRGRRARGGEGGHDIGDELDGGHFVLHRVVMRRAAALVLELLEAPLRRLGAAVELRLRLVETPLVVRRDSFRERRLVAFEPTGGV